MREQVLAYFGHEQDALGREELLCERSGDVAAFAEELANEAADQALDGAAVIDVARRQAEGQELTTVVDDQMQLDAVEPADRGLWTIGAFLRTASAVESRKLMPVQLRICVYR